MERVKQAGGRGLDFEKQLPTVLEGKLRGRMTLWQEGDPDQGTRFP